MTKRPIGRLQILRIQVPAQRGLGDQALALLDQYSLYSSIPLHRNIICLNSVLQALARESRNDAIDRGMSFLEKMNRQDSYANPDAISYRILFRALMRSEGCRHAERGRGLLEEMMQRVRQGDESCRPPMPSLCQPS